MPKPLSDEEVSRTLRGLPGWERVGSELVRTVTAPDFLTGIAVVDAVGRAAEEAGHHPDIDIRWRKLRFALTTHDAGSAITALDIALASRINEIVAGAGAH